MSLIISSLNSGSNGNCYYIGNGEDAILVDLGISCRELEKRMLRLRLPIEKIKAIFISHEHTDHIKGISSFIKKYSTPIYFTKDTLSRCKFSSEGSFFYTFNNNQSISIGKLNVTAFSKSHDAIDPHSFIIENNGTTVGVFTDIGQVCSTVTRFFKKCDAAFLESNYCDELLENGNYPYFLKNRIRNGKGHLSNKQALNLFENYKSDNLKLLILSHLSHNNNHENLVNDLFTHKANDTKIVVASRLRETDIFEVNGSSLTMTKTKPLDKQISLF